MFKQGVKILIIFCLVFSFCNVLVTSASYTSGLEETAKEGFGVTDVKKIPLAEAGGIPGIAGKLIGAGLAFIGILFFGLMVYGGILWMTARGNEEQVTKAKDLITAALIGLIIVLSAYAITAFIGGALTTSSSTGK